VGLVAVSLEVVMGSAVVGLVGAEVGLEVVGLEVVVD